MVVLVNLYFTDLKESAIENKEDRHLLLVNKRKVDDRHKH